MAYLPCRHDWHQLYHLANGFDCHPELGWPDLFWNDAPFVVPMCSKQSEHLGNGLRQLGHDDNLLIFDDADRTRASSYIQADTFLPQKLHDKNTDFECFGDEFIWLRTISKCARCSHRRQISSNSRYDWIQYWTLGSSSKSFGRNFIAIRATVWTSSVPSK